MNVTRNSPLNKINKPEKKKRKRYILYYHFVEKKLHNIEKIKKDD